MLRRLALLALLLTSCWGTNCPGWDATPKAGYERMSAYRLGHCRVTSLCIPSQQKTCFQAARNECLDAGFGATCSQMENEWGCGPGAK